MKRITNNNMDVIDLFCGCGGMSLGFQKAGFDVIAAYDNWESAISVYNANFNHKASNVDILSDEIIDKIEECRPDVIIGGPPCQDFSTAGHMNENGGRAKLTTRYVEIISNIKPRFFVMENVLQARKSETYQAALEILKKAGYGLSKVVIDACYCNVPQYRKRFFVVGELDGEDDFLTNQLISKQNTLPMSIHDYLGDSLGTEYYFRVPTNYNRRGVFSIYEPSMTIRGVDRPIPKGYKGHPEDPVPIGPMVRALTVKERSLIQTFPESFTLSGTKTDLNQMIGNAVPVNLAYFVASVLREYIESRGE